MGSLVLSSRLYVRGIGLVLACTFVSLATQLDILLGPQGLSPVATQLRPGISFWRRPTVLWLLGDGDAALWTVVLLGLFGSLWMAWGRARLGGVLLAYVAYLSLVNAGGIFFQFQWDNLILEALTLCLLLPLRDSKAPSPLVVVAFRFLLARLYLESGVVKWAWGAQSWGAHQAMDHYYETSPLPLMLGFVAHNLPHAWHLLEEAATFAIEIGLPFFFFGPRRLRLLAVVPGVLLQVIIGLTSSYGSFNFMAALLFVWLLDDEAWHTLRQRLGRPALPLAEAAPTRVFTTRAAGVFAVAHMTLASASFAGMMRDSLSFGPVEQVLGVLSPFRPINNYHLFADVTLQRPVVEVEWSMDGETFTPLHFKHAPGHANELPPLLLAPHHPRVAFQMWFLALRPRADPWFVRLLDGVCQPQSPVHSLFVTPVPSPPAFLRVSILDYRMASLSQWWDNGTVWTIKTQQRMPARPCAPSVGAR